MPNLKNMATTATPNPPVTTATPTPPVAAKTANLKSVLIVLALIAALVSSACSKEPEIPLAGIKRHPTPNVAHLTMPRADTGTEMAFVAEPNKLLLVYFGFTSCPDICPTTMSETRLAFDKLKDDAERIDVTFVSVDPERDTGPITDSYIKSFFADGIGMRSDDAQQLATAAEVFGARYRIDKDTQYDVDHSGDLYVVDDQGDIILIWTFGVPASNIASDLTTLLEQLDKR